MLHPLLVAFLTKANRPDFRISRKVHVEGRDVVHPMDVRQTRFRGDGPFMEKYRRAAAMFGLKFVGQGCFATAFRMLDGRVVKIGSSEDDGYAFHEWCMANRGAPGVPYVYELVTLPGGQWYVVMEFVKVSPGNGGASREARSAAYQFSEDTGASSWDLHSGNWGYTQDGRSVIIDPTGCDSVVGVPPAHVLPTKRLHGPRPARLARWH